MFGCLIKFKKVVSDNVLIHEVDFKEVILYTLYAVPRNNFKYTSNATFQVEKEKIFKILTHTCDRLICNSDSC